MTIKIPGIDFKRIKKSTFTYLALLAAGSAVSQTMWVRNHVIPIVDRHPHIAFLGPALLTFLTLIHNPQVSQIISTLSAEETTTQPDGSIKTATLVSETSIPVPPAKS